MMKTATILIIALCFCLQSPSLGAELPESFETGDRFTMRLPDGWKPIPREVLDDYSDAMAKLAPQAGKQTFNYGFQLASSKKWFEYPYILVQVNSSGRVPEEQLESMARIGKAMDEGFDRTRESLSSVVDDARIGEISYEPASNILWTRIALDVKGFGAVSGLIGSVLTEQGFIQISCNARKSDFAGYLPLFEAIVRETEVDPGLRYRPGNRESSPADHGSVWIWALVSGVLAGSAAALFFRLRRGSRLHPQNRSESPP